MGRLDEIKKQEIKLLEEIGYLHRLGQHGLLYGLREKLEDIKKEKERLKEFDENKIHRNQEFENKIFDWWRKI